MCIVARLVRSVRRVRFGLKHLAYHPLLHTLLCRPRLDFSLTSLSHPLLKRTSFAKHVHLCIKNSPAAVTFNFIYLTTKVIATENNYLSVLHSDVFILEYSAVMFCCAVTSLDSPYWESKLNDNKNVVFSRRYH